MRGDVCIRYSRDLLLSLRLDSSYPSRVVCENIGAIVRPAHPARHDVAVALAVTNIVSPSTLTVRPARSQSYRALDLWLLLLLVTQLRAGSASA